MNPKSTNDPFGLEAAFKQIADEFNKGVEQAKRIRECKMRRFFLPSMLIKGASRHDGVVFSNGQVVIYDDYYRNIQVFSSLEAYKDHYECRGIQWIDPEPAA